MVSNEVLATLLGIGLVLPIGIGGIAYLIEDHLASSPLWSKIVVVLLWVASIGFFVAVAFPGGTRFDDGAGDFAVYWVAGVIIVIASGCWLLDIYD